MSVLTSETPATVAPALIGRIPVRNLWLLMLYASDLYRTEREAFAGAEDNPDDLADLVARLLANEVESRLRRQLTASYQPKHAELNRVRGRIDMLTTERRQLLARGRVACRFEDMTIDTPRNRFVRAALEKIAALATTPEVTRRCRALAATLRGMGVAGLTPTRAALSLERFSRNDADDRRMVAAATLAFDLALPSEAGDAHWLAQPQRQETWVRHLFEKAVAGFYDIALQADGWVVRPGKSLYWQIEDKTAGIDRILPSMRTDIILEHAAKQRRLVIDTKFAAILSRGWYRDQTLRNAYLYQIYAYLRSQVGRGDPLADRASGLLLHPAVNGAVDEAVIIQGHAIRFATVDLAAPSRAIRQQLLRAVRDYGDETNSLAKGPRIVTWNCMRRLEAKRDAFEVLAPELAVICEATAEGVAALGVEDAICSEPLEGRGGLCVALVANNGWRLEKLAEAADRHVLAARASKDGRTLTLVGVWMLPDKGDYVTPLLRALAEVEPCLGGDVVIAGDFNAHPQWDVGKGVGRQFASVVKWLGERGLTSLWHHHSGERHGEETTPTFFMNLKAEKPFHIDYAFASQALAQKCRSVEIGAHAQWVATKLSDHAPLIVDLTD